jgi:hypothetical protein
MGLERLGCYALWKTVDVREGMGVFIESGRRILRGFEWVNSGNEFHELHKIMGNIVQA